MPSKLHLTYCVELEDKSLRNSNDVFGGILCVGTDAPTLGGVNQKDALFTYWALATRGMVGIEFLTKLDQLPPKAFFIFAPVKIEGSHGGIGRAIALY